MRKEYYGSADESPSDSLEDLSEIEDAAATSADRELVVLVEAGENKQRAEVKIHTFPASSNT